MSAERYALLGNRPARDRVIALGSDGPRTLEQLAADAERLGRLFRRSRATSRAPC